MTGNTFTDEDVAEAWSRNTARWTADVRAGFDKYRDLYTFPAFLSFMPEIANRQVIDLGCGEGTNTRKFAELGGQMTGIDISDAMLADAREEEHRQPLGITYRKCSFSHMPGIASGSFDVALSTMALMDGPDFEGAMRETYRALVPGGRLCFSILHPCFITTAIQWLRDGEAFPTGLKVGNYFETSPFIEHWKFSKRPNPEVVPEFEVHRFPRTLSDYLNAVMAAGFRLTGILEPRPNEAVSEEYAWLARWRTHAPLVLFVSAVKD